MTSDQHRPNSIRTRVGEGESRECVAQSSIVQRNALLELLARELLEAARQHVVRRARKAIPRNAKSADLDRLLDLK